MTFKHMFSLNKKKKKKKKKLLPLRGYSQKGQEEVNRKKKDKQIISRTVLT